ncbi:MAG: adenylyl-sulfate kinase [Lentisphaerales bacterium]|nr:adenylyl-sulfate kinase [Lentisphaerales bacterium]
MKDKNIVWHNHSVSQEMRHRLNDHKPAVIWFTGFSGSGKSTIANHLENELYKLGCHTYLLDGDNVRHGLNRDLGFTHSDRVENIRRMGEVAKLFADAGQIVLTAFISPFKSDRAMVRGLLPEGQFIEVFVDTPLEECEKRDPKGLYKKARAGEIGYFTGISSPYEAPEDPEVAIDTINDSNEQSVARIIDYLREKEITRG